MKLQSHKDPSVKLNMDSPHIVMVKIRFQNFKNSHFVYIELLDVECTLTTGTGIESSSDLKL